jgi:hypothetical protein
MAELEALKIKHLALINELEELSKMAIMGNAGNRNLPAFVKRFVSAIKQAKA